MDVEAKDLQITQTDRHLRRKKMTKKAIGMFALALGLTAMFATSSLSAQESVYSNKVAIPFAFHVEKVALPAGEYRIERVFGKEIVTLVNLQTGQRVQILWPEATRTPGKSKLVFETGPQGYSLKKLS
jgi:hypothetical protein